MHISIFFPNFIFHFQFTSRLTISNIVCEEYDKDFATIDYCYLKAINRTYKYLSVKVNLHKAPLTNFTLGIALLKRENGWKPFLYNVSFNACKFLKSKHRNPVAEYLASIFLPYTNINHSCPIVVSLTLFLKTIAENYVP